MFNHYYDHVCLTVAMAMYAQPLLLACKLEVYHEHAYFAIFMQLVIIVTVKTRTFAVVTSGPLHNRVGHASVEAQKSLLADRRWRLSTRLPLSSARCTDAMLTF